MERLAIGIRVSALINIIVNDEEDMAGLAIGRRVIKRPFIDGGNDLAIDIFREGGVNMVRADQGFEEQPFVPRFYKIVVNETTKRYGSIEIDIDPNDLAYFTFHIASNTYRDEILRANITPDHKLDFIDSFSINRGASTDFAFAFFPKEDLEGIMSQSTNYVIISGALIQPGRGSVDYGDVGTQYFTLKIEHDAGPGSSTSADVGMPEFIVGPPCPPHWK